MSNMLIITLIKYVGNTVKYTYINDFLRLWRFLLFVITNFPFSRTFGQYFFHFFNLSRLCWFSFGLFWRHFEKQFNKVWNMRIVQVSLCVIWSTNRNWTFWHTRPRPFKAKFRGQFFVSLFFVPIVDNFLFKFFGKKLGNSCLDRFELVIDFSDIWPSLRVFKKTG